MEAARMFDGSWLAFSSHGTHAVVFLLAFQGKSQNAENKRVRRSIKYSLPIGSVVFANSWELCPSCSHTALASIIPAFAPTYSRWLVTLLHGRSSNLPRRAWMNYRAGTGEGMSSEIESSAVVGTSNGASLVLWDTFGRRCRVTMRCVLVWGHGFARVGAFVYICTLLSLLRSPEGGLARAQSRLWFLHTYIRGTSDKDVTRLDDEEGRQRGKVLLLIWSRRKQSGRRFMQVKALK